jgi:membrane-bound lytic murein transglycosylase D
MTRHWLILGIAAGLGTGCARARIAEAPAPVATDSAIATATGTTAQADTLPMSAADLAAGDDSAADRAVLDALAELDFGSIDRRGTRARGQSPSASSSTSPGEIDHQTSRLFNDGTGGPASAADVAHGLDVEAFANHRRVQYYLDFFLGPARDRFAIWLGRLPRYEGMIREQLRRFGVPEDLVYLAMIESGYSNTAVSRAHAVGMWQFIAGTGRHYGLVQDQWVDERRDPFQATEAAARHLADLNAEFGSWYLAAAAYNGGARRVSRGLERLGDDGESSDSAFFRLADRRYLRLETRDYVPKLIAAALIAADPESYGFDSVPRLEPLRYDEVEITEATGLDVLARLADTTTRSLVELNPHFIRGVTPPHRKVIVRVPAGRGDQVARRWAEMPANERVTFVTHRIAKNETLSGIAQRYHVGLSVLRSANPGVQARRLRIGQVLTIPVSPAAQRSVRRSPPTRATPRRTSPGATFYTVRSGDSLWEIARRHGVHVADLRTWNGLEGELLHVGQRLRVAAP